MLEQIQNETKIDQKVGLSMKTAGSSQNSLGEGYNDCITLMFNYLEEVV